MKDILPSMPKGEIVGNVATAKMTHMIKVVIDGNYNNEVWRTWVQEHRSCNKGLLACFTNANIDAATLMASTVRCMTNGLTVATVKMEGSERLNDNAESRCRNHFKDSRQMVKLVIEDNSVGYTRRKLK